MSQESTETPQPGAPKYLLIKLEDKDHAAEIQNVLGGLKDTDASDAVKLHFTRGDITFPDDIQGNVMFASALRPGGGGGRDIEVPDDDQSEEDTPEEDSSSEKSDGDNEA